MRVYALFGAGLVLVFLPGFLAKLGVDRVRPVQLASIPRSDGSLPGLVLAEQRKTSIAAISMDDGPWVPAGGWKVSRELRYLPPGTPVAFRETAAANGDRAISGRVVETRRSPEAIAAALSLSLVAVAFAIAGAGMAAGATNRLALLAAGMLAGFGHFLAAHFLEPNASMVADPSWRNGVVLLWISFPRHLSFLWLLSFLSVFPTDLWSTRVSRYSRRLLATLALFQVVFMFVSQLPGTFERLSPARQALTLGVARRLLLLIFVLGSVSALSLLVQQVRSYRRAAVAGQTRRRAEILRAAFLVGFGPALVLAVAQASSLALTGELAVSRTVMAFSYLPALLIPPALAYSVLAPRVESVGILVRKAALFGFAQKTVRVAALVPLAGLAFYLWMHRQSRLDELLALHPFLLAGAVGASIVGLTTADRARGAVERLFFRRKGDAARTLRELAEKTREAKDVAELADLLTSGSDKALGLESAALFVREPGSGTFACEGKSLPSLEAASVIAEEALRSKGPLEVAPDDPGTPLHGLPELDRSWLEATRARLLVPLTGSGGDLLALLVLGDKRSELPYDREDEQLLGAAAASASLALENQMLRSSGASEGDRASREATADFDPAEPRSEAGLSCRRCGRIFASGSGALCLDDDTPLEPAPVPHLLAGKYRFEKRIGAGGMGVVYRARDVSLSRDVAIKVLPRVSHVASRRLRREARAAARLIHPNLGLIFAAESWRGTPMLVLEFLDGGTLQERIECGEIPCRDVVDWGIHLAGALEAAHSQGLLHRDIKPSNIGFTSRGVPKLLDFGLVRLLDDPAAADAAGIGLAGPIDPLDSTASGLFHLTASGRVAGTPPYLSPEAVQGEPPSAGFDVWGLTLTLYEALTGANPFAVAPTERAFNLILTTAIPDPRHVRPDCPEAVAAFFGKALSRSPWERPSTAHELRRRLGPLLG